ncbi:MAG: mgtE [Chloroflexi bacterium]|nr:mgtE [Chloroflexota bacterium]
MRLQSTHVDTRHLRELLADGNTAAAAELAFALTPTELADLLVRLGPTELALLESHLGTERIADAVAELDPSEAARLLVRFSRAEAADILEEMEPDDATDVVEELGEGEAEHILAEMRSADAEEIRELLAYPPQTAGGRMTPDFVAISPGLTVAAAMRLIRAQAPDAETIYYVYVTDRYNRLQGVVSLRDLVLAEPRQLIADVMRRQVIHVPAAADQEQAARLLLDHNLLALPVVDYQGRLLGVITIDDVADVLEEEATEDIEKLGGSQPLEEPYLSASMFQIFRKRIVWLLVLFLAATQTSTVISIFSLELEHVVALSFFIPLLIGTGGNVGSQIVTTVVRAMAVGEVRFTHLWRVLGRELVICLVVGLVMAAATMIRAGTMNLDLGIAVSAALAALFIVLWAGSVAAMLPMVLRRLGLDPAVMSAPLITTFVDGTGLLIYFLIARAVLNL